MEIYPIYAGGKFIATNKKLDVYNSFNGELFAQTYLADAVVLEKAIQAAEKALPIMKNMPSYEKYAILMEIASEMKRNEKHLAEVLAMEACKPIKYALAEIARAIQTIIVAAEESKRLQGEYMSIDWTAAGKGKEG